MNNRIRSNSKVALLAGFASAILAPCAFGQAAAPAPVPFQALLPASATIVTSSNTPYWWNALAGLRQIPEVRKAMMQLETSGFSLDRDVFSWAGQSGFVMDFPQAMLKGAPPVAFLIQIKDQTAFDAAFAKLLSKVGSGKSGPKVSTYGGTTIYSDPAPVTGTSPSFGLAQSHGWLIVGMGAHVVENEIDLTNGAGAPLTANAQWTAALANIGPSDQNWIAIDYGKYLAGIAAMSKTLGKGSMGMGMDPSGFAPLQSVMTLKVTPSATGFATESKIYPSTDAGRSLWKLLGAGAAPDTSLLQRVPGATGITILRSGSSFWNFENTVMKPMLESGTQKQGGKMVEQFLNMFGPVATQFTGPVAFALTSKAGHGLGMVIMAQASSHEAAESTAGAIAGLLNVAQIPIDQNGETWKLSTAPVNGKPSPFASLSAMGTMFGEDVNPEIEVDGPWLQITTSPTWTHEVNQVPTLQLPAFAANTYEVSAGNFKFLQPIEGWINVAQAHATDGTMPQFGKILSGLNLDNSTYQYAASVDPDTGVVTDEGSIDNWDWNGALTNTASFIVDAVKIMSAARPHPVHNPVVRKQVVRKHAAPTHKHPSKIKHAVVKHYTH